MLSFYVAVLMVYSVSAVYKPARYPPIVPVDPPLVGYCNPNWRPVPCPRIPLRHQCDRNQDCRHRQICCKDDCGNRICRSRGIIPPPIKRCPNDRPFICLDRHGRDQCYRNSDCNRNQICCKNACNYNVCRRRDIVIRPKPGRCPQSLVSSSRRICGIRNRNRCNNDHDCPGKQKCCSDICGNSICSNPILNTYGR